MENPKSDTSLYIDVSESNSNIERNNLFNGY